MGGGILTPNRFTYVIPSGRRGIPLNGRGERRRVGCLSNLVRLVVPIRAQVLPFRVFGSDQLKFLASSPALDLLLTRECCLSILGCLVVDEPRDVVFAGEAWCELVLVFVDAALEVAGDACV